MLGDNQLSGEILEAQQPTKLRSATVHNPRGRVTSLW